MIGWCIVNGTTGAAMTVTPDHETIERSLNPAKEVLSRLPDSVEKREAPNLVKAWGAYIRRIGGREMRLVSDRVEPL